jgi:hypothetical protein
MIATLRDVSPRRGAYKGLGDLLPKRARPPWVAQIGAGKARGALTPAAAKAQGQLKRQRARKSLDIRGVPGFLAAIRPAPSSVPSLRGVS